jgi:hypothetical protein
MNTVKELIEQLKKYPPNFDVFIGSDDNVSLLEIDTLQHSKYKQYKTFEDVKFDPIIVNPKNCVVVKGALW